MENLQTKIVQDEAQSVSGQPAPKILNIKEAIQCFSQRMSPQISVSVKQKVHEVCLL